MRWRVMRAPVAVLAVCAVYVLLAMVASRTKEKKSVAGRTRQPQQPQHLSVQVVDESGAMMYYAQRDLPAWLHVLHQRCASVDVSFSFTHQQSKKAATPSTLASSSLPVGFSLPPFSAQQDPQEETLRLCFAMTHSRAACMPSLSAGTSGHHPPLISMLPWLRNTVWRKDAFCRTMEWWLQAATQTQGASAAVSLRLMSAHIPCKPFVMDANGFAELRKFMASYSTAHAFVIKPATMGEGKGVFAVDSAEEAEAVLTKLSQQQQKQQQQQQQQQHWQAHTYVVSPLLNNPLLVHGHKVDLRCYVLLKGTASALHANMLNDCLVRFALDAYDPSAHRGGRRTQWMTNTYLSQHKLEDSSQHEQRQRSQQSQQQRQQQQQPRGDGRGHEAFGGAVWRLQQLADHLVHTGDTDLLAALRSSELGMDQRRKGTTKHSKQKTGRRRGGRQHGPGAIFNEDELQQASVYEELLRRAASSIRPVLLAAQLQAQDAAAAAAAAAAANGRSGRGGRTAQDSSLGKKNSGGNGDSARQGRSTLKGDACKHCFQLLGVDVFVSSALEMHVIEVNGLPSMSQHIDDAQYRALKHTLLHTTLDTLGVCPRRHAPPASSWHQHDTAPSSPSSSSSPSRLLVSGTNEGMLPLLPVHGKHNARAGEWIVPLSAQERDMLSKLRQ